MSRAGRACRARRRCRPGRSPTARGLDTRGQEVVLCTVYCVLCTMHCSARMLGTLTDRDNVENSSDHRHQQYCAQMIEKQSINN